MDMVTHLQAIYNTLDEIEVRGHANVKRMSLCMDYLKELHNEAMKGDANNAAEGEGEKEMDD